MLCLWAQWSIPVLLGSPSRSSQTHFFMALPQAPGMQHSPTCQQNITDMQRYNIIMILWVRFQPLSCLSWSSSLASSMGPIHPENNLRWNFLQNVPDNSSIRSQFKPNPVYQFNPRWSNISINVQSRCCSLSSYFNIFQHMFYHNYPIPFPYSSIMFNPCSIQVLLHWTSY